jgi:hypothetical protein
MTPQETGNDNRKSSLPRHCQVALQKQKELGKIYPGRWSWRAQSHHLQLSLGPGKWIASGRFRHILRRRSPANRGAIVRAPRRYEQDASPASGATSSATKQSRIAAIVSRAEGIAKDTPSDGRRRSLLALRKSSGIPCRSFVRHSQ